MTPLPVTVVSGLPRSGTSLMMQMLVAAGIEPLTDKQRSPDPDNPEGYFELEAVKTTRSDPSWLPSARGKAVKVIHALLPDLPSTESYRIILMQRDLDEVLASQAKMLERSGRRPAPISHEALKRVYSSQLEAARRWIAAAPNAALLEVSYNQLLSDPVQQAARIAAFLDCPDRAVNMAAAIRPHLYRNRSTPPS